MRRALRIVGRALGAVLALGLVLFAGLYLSWRHPLPAAAEGDAAEALARRINAAVRADAWARTGAIRWTAPDGGRHLWDRARNLARYERGGLHVLVDLGTRHGLAWQDGHKLQGPARHRAVERAWARWANDSFWLNPVPKMYDDGVRRGLVHDDDGRDALLVTYTLGGVTPGDRYLWRVDGDGRPRAWRMWVSILPIPGLEATWQGWITLPTGAKVATEHRVAGLTLRLRDIAAAETLSALEGAVDPFTPLATER